MSLFRRYIFIIISIGLVNETGVPDANSATTRYDICTNAKAKVTTLLLWRDEKNTFITSKIAESTNMKDRIKKFIDKLSQ